MKIGYPMFNFSLNNKRSPDGLRYTVRIPAGIIPALTRPSGFRSLMGGCFYVR